MDAETHHHGDRPGATHTPVVGGGMAKSAHLADVRWLPCHRAGRGGGEHRRGGHRPSGQWGVG